MGMSNNYNGDLFDAIGLPEIERDDDLELDVVGITLHMRSKGNVKFTMRQDFNKDDDFILWRILDEAPGQIGNGPNRLHYMLADILDTRRKEA